jgi:hypothetical protein
MGIDLEHTEILRKTIFCVLTVRNAVIMWLYRVIFYIFNVMGTCSGGNIA